MLIREGKRCNKEVEKCCGIVKRMNSRQGETDNGTIGGFLCVTEIKVRGTKLLLKDMMSGEDEGKGEKLPTRRLSAFPAKNDTRSPRTLFRTVGNQNLRHF